MYHTQVASCVATGLPQKYAHIDRQIDRSKDTHIHTVHTVHTHTHTHTHTLYTYYILVPGPLPVFFFSMLHLTAFLVQSSWEASQGARPFTDTFLCEEARAQFLRDGTRGAEGQVGSSQTSFDR